jgi:FMN phosphatase YigB (HAD superfamily)
MGCTLIRVVFFDLGDTLVRRVATTPAGQRFDWIPGAKEVLSELRQLAVSMGVISNTGNLPRHDLRRMMPPDFSFDAFVPDLVLLSSEVGKEKPDPEIFQLAVRRAQAALGQVSPTVLVPSCCLFCGESLEETLAAQQIGMVSARVDPQPEPDIGTLVRRLQNAGFFGQAA